MNDQREDGFYWVKRDPSDRWEPAEFYDGAWIFIEWSEHDIWEKPIAIGPKIEKPEGLV